MIALACIVLLNVSHIFFPVQNTNVGNVIMKTPTFVFWIFVDVSVHFAATFTSPCTNAVVANCVVFVPAVAVGAVGVPVKVGESMFAFKSNWLFTTTWLLSVAGLAEIVPFDCMVSTPLFTIVPKSDFPPNGLNDIG